MSSPRRRSRGFTLIEVLVALALMSLIGTILIESLRVGGHAWRRVTREAANVEEIARAQSFLRQHLETVYPPEAVTTLASSGSFVGESDTLEFSGSAPGHSDNGLARYQLGLSASQQGDVEIRYRNETRDPLGAPVSGWSTESLVSHANGLEIQFWQESPGSSGRWVSHWEDPTKLPRLIRIDVRFADNDPRRWPPLYVEPRLDTRATCVFDVVSRRCRAGV